MNKENFRTKKFSNWELTEFKWVNKSLDTMILYSEVKSETVRNNQKSE